MRFSDWLSSGWNIAKNVADKVGNFIEKVAPMIGSFIEQAASIVRTIGNFMSYLPDKLGTIGKMINNVASRVDSVTGMLLSGLREKVEQYRDRGTTSINFGYIVDQIGRNF
jgi:phage-related protein